MGTGVLSELHIFLPVAVALDLNRIHLSTGLRMSSKRLLLIRSEHKDIALCFLF
jgi:hypothetical protein